MAIFGIDANQSGSTQSQTRRTQDRLTRGRESGTQQTGTKSGAETTQKQTQLDPVTLGILQNVTNVLSAGVTAGAGSVSPTFSVENLVETNKAEEIRRFEDDTMRQINQLSSRTGSRDNSFTKQLIGEGREDLAVRLAALGSQLTLAGRKSESEVSGNRSLDLARIATVLKGSETDVAGTSKAETVETLNKLIESLTGETTDFEEFISGNTAQTGTQGRDLIDFFKSTLPFLD